MAKIRGLKFTKIKGGPGSGHHGHAGRPGQLGGSAPGDAAAGAVGRGQLSRLTVTPKAIEGVLGENNPFTIAPIRDDQLAVSFGGRYSRQLTEGIAKAAGGSIKRTRGAASAIITLEKSMTRETTSAIATYLRGRLKE